MDLVNFINGWEGHETLPVEIEEHVYPRILAFNTADEIYCFWDLELHIGTLRGHHVRDNIPDGEGGTRRRVTVTYGRGTNEMMRLVSCKELIHTLDPEGCKTGTRPEIESLMAKIALPSNLVDATDGVHVLTDRMVTILALAVLIPLAARNILWDHFKAGKISLEKIAAMAEVPPEYAGVVFHDEWPDTLRSILSAVVYLHEAKKTA